MSHAHRSACILHALCVLVLSSCAGKSGQVNRADADAPAPGLPLTGQPALKIPAPDSIVYTDAFPSYTRMDMPEYQHKVIDHQQCYAIGDIHTNGIENFWSLFKRCVKGTWIHIDADHTNRYLDEQSFRFNTRKGTDSERFEIVATGASGKRLTWKQLVGEA